MMLEPQYHRPLETGSYRGDRPCLNRPVNGVTGLELDGLFAVDPDVYFSSWEIPASTLATNGGK